MQLARVISGLQSCRSVRMSQENRRRGTRGAMRKPGCKVRTRFGSPSSPLPFIHLRTSASSAAVVLAATSLEAEANDELGSGQTKAPGREGGGFPFQEVLPFRFPYISKSPTITKATPMPMAMLSTVSLI